jgi:G protein-coupled receptor 125
MRQIKVFFFLFWTVTSNNKGVYTWPKTVVGYTVELQCEGEQLTGIGYRPPLKAQYTCMESGVWERLNTTVCPYVSETTKILEQFSKVCSCMNIL